MPGASHDAVQRELQRILASKTFVHSERMSRFLRFTVEQVLAGKREEIKEDVLGAEVFDREPSYDPRSDPIVRVEARRLRYKLHEYYSGEGAADPIRIELPKGGYAPVFQQRAAGLHRAWIALALGLTVILITTAAWMIAHARRKVAASAPSIAVLPFVDMSPQKDQGYFCDGMTEELTQALSRILGLRVPARTSVFQLRSADIHSVGQRLHVDWVLEGSVRKDGDRVRITVQLVRVSDDSHLWSETYDRDVRGVFAIQEEISRAIVKKLRIQLASGRRVVKPATEDPEAHKLYLEGRYFATRSTPASALKAVDLLERAIARDPNSAPAQANLAKAYGALAFYGGLPAKVAYPKATRAARRALELDDSLPEAHTAMAGIKVRYEWDWEAADREYRRALELDPNDAAIHGEYAWELDERGRFEEAIQETKRARDLDPASVQASYQLCGVLYHARKYDEAIGQCHKTLEMDSGYVRAYHTLGRAYTQKRMYTEAIAAMSKWADAPLVEQGMLGYVLAVSGRRAEAEKIAEAMIQKYKERQSYPFAIAMIYAGLGDKDRSFEWLERAYADHAFLLTLKVNPEVDGLRSDPRFVALLKRIGLGD